MTVSQLILRPTASRHEKRREDRVLSLYTLHDVTVRKRSEEAERRAKEMHEAASAAKPTLIDVMSHELRTPLNSVVGFVKMVADASLGEHTTPEYGEFGRMIGDSGRQLLAVVNDMLLAARFQSGDVVAQPRDFEVGDAVDKAVSRVQGRAHWRQQTLALDPEVRRRMVFADYELTVTALYHLFDNAAKFAGPNASIRVAVEDDGTIAVEDDGPGLGALSRGDAVTLFVQGDGSRTRTHEGCGIGLFLVDRIAAVHGGNLSVGFARTGGTYASVQLNAQGEMGGRQRPSREAASAFSEDAA